MNYWIFVSLSSQHTQSSFPGMPCLYHDILPKTMPQWVEECKHSTETEKWEMWKSVSVCAFWGVAVNGETTQIGESREDAERDWRRRMKRRRGRKRRNRRNVFSIRSIWCCIPQARYPEGDPHCILGCLAHQGVIMGHHGSHPPKPKILKNSQVHYRVSIAFINHKLIY